MWLNFYISTVGKNVNLTKAIQTFLENNVEELENMINFATSLANLGKFFLGQRP